MVLSFMRGGQKRDAVVEEPVVLEEAPVIEPPAVVAASPRAVEFVSRRSPPVCIASMLLPLVRTRRRRWCRLLRRGDGVALDLRPRRRRFTLDPGMRAKKGPRRVAG